MQTTTTKDRKTTVCSHVSVKLIERMEQIANEKRRTVSSLIAEVLEDRFREQGK